MSVSLNTAAPLQRPAPLSSDIRDGGDGRPAGSAAPPVAGTATAGAESAYTISTSPRATDPTSVAGVQPDIDGDGARLMALSIQQAMSSSTGSIANASTQSILGLFRG